MTGQTIAKGPAGRPALVRVGDDTFEGTAIVKDGTVIFKGALRQRSRIVEDPTSDVGYRREDGLREPTERSWPLAAVLEVRWLDADAA